MPILVSELATTWISRMAMNMPRHMALKPSQVGKDFFRGHAGQLRKVCLAGAARMARTAFKPPKAKALDRASLWRQGAWLGT